MAVHLERISRNEGTLGDKPVIHDVIKVNDKEVSVVNNVITGIAMAILEPNELKALEWFVKSPLDIKSSLYNGN